MNDAVIVATIAALPPTLAAVLSFAANRSVRRSIATQGDAPIGAIVERLEHQVETLASGVGEINRRVARLEGRTTMPLQLRRRVDVLQDDLHGLAERVARIEFGGGRS